MLFYHTNQIVLEKDQIRPVYELKVRDTSGTAMVFSFLKPIQATLIDIYILI